MSEPKQSWGAWLLAGLCAVGYVGWLSYKPPFTLDEVVPCNDGRLHDFVGQMLRENTDLEIHHVMAYMDFLAQDRGYYENEDTGEASRTCIGEVHSNKGRFALQITTVKKGDGQIFVEYEEIDRSTASLRSNGYIRP